MADLSRSPSNGPLTLFEGSSPSKIDYRTKEYPYSNLSTGGPRFLDQSTKEVRPSMWVMGSFPHLTPRVAALAPLLGIGKEISAATNENCPSSLPEFINFRLFGFGSF